MRDVDVNPGADQDERLPIHPWTILVGVLRHRRFLLILALACVVTALAIALLFGRPVYQAQSVLLYHPEADGRSNDPALTVQTQANMVLLDSNLEETRRRLDMPVSLKQLAAACHVKTQPNTALIIIDVGWNSPETAAKIANTLRDVFLYNQRNVRQASAAVEVRDLGSRIDELRARLKAIDNKLGEFSDTSGLVDLEKETQNYLAELSNAELLFDQARADKQSIEMQIRSGKQMLTRAQPSGSVRTEPLSDLNTRANRLRDTIHEDQTIRAAQAELEGLKIQRDQKLALYREGLASKAEYEKAEAAFEAQKQRAIDTYQVKTWRTEMARLDEEILPRDGSAVSSRDAQQKLFQLELDRIAAESKVEKFGQTVDRLRKKIAGLPKLQRNFLTFSRESESNETELKSLLEKLGRAERAQAAKSGEFVTIADATPPAFPVRSRRTVIFLAISAFGMLLGLAAVLSKELLNGTVRSAGEAAVKLPIPLLGVVPKMTGYRGLPKDDTEAVSEPYRALALHVRRTVPKRGARLMFVSARPGEGVSTVIAYLADSLRRDHLSVLIKNVQSEDTATDSYDIILLDGPPILESIDSEAVAPSCDAAVIVVASGVTPVRDITDAITRIRSTRVPIAGAVLNRVDPVYL